MDRHRNERTVGAKLGDRLLSLLRVERLPVPVLLVFEKRDASPFDRLRDNYDRTGRVVQSVGICAINRVEIVSIDFNRLPAKRASAGGVSGAIPAQVGLSTLTQSVHVQDGNQIIQRVMARVVKSLPN